MSRPKPKTLLQHTNNKSFKMEEILEASAIYAVFHKQKPINLKTSSIVSNYPGPKYKKVSFSNSGHAFNLADRLNKKFNTTAFTVVRLLEGETIKRDSDDTK